MASSSSTTAPTPDNDYTRRALIAGATGAVGRQLLASLLSDSNYSSVVELGRRATSYPQKGVSTPDAQQLSKLEAVVITNEDFEDPSRISNKLSKVPNWQTVYITLATSRANAGSAAAFEKIDREYVVNAAQAALRTGLKQRLVYCSSTGADPQSSFLYMRSKRLTE